jgi:hypothetical protein
MRIGMVQLKEYENIDILRWLGIMVICFSLPTLTLG